MTNTSHYPNLENCKLLTEAGFPNTEKKLWNEECKCKICGNPPPGPAARHLCKYEEGVKSFYVYPSVMELLDELPELIEEDGCGFFRTIFPNSAGYYNFSKIPRKTLISFFEENPDALAKCWLWCKKNNYLPNK